LKYAYFNRLQAAVILTKGLYVKIHKTNYFICFERKNAWSRFALILFKLTEIWLVDSQKINKTVATGCHILKLKCTKFNFGCGSAPDTTGGAYSALPDMDSRGPTSKGMERTKNEREGQGTGRREGRDLLLRRGRGEGRYRVSPQT